MKKKVSGGGDSTRSMDTRTRDGEIFQFLSKDRGNHSDNRRLVASPRALAVNHQHTDEH